MKYLLNIYRNSYTLICYFLSLFHFVPFGFMAFVLRNGSLKPHPLVPRGFSDMILNKMMFPDNISRAVVADKIAVRGWVAERVGAQHLVPLYDVCASAADLRRDYPLPCVIKSNHASAQVRLVRDMADYNGIDEQAAGWLSKPYMPKLEWVYGDIEPRLMVEKMLQDAGNLAPDIKVHCIFGQPVFIFYTRARDVLDSRFFFTPDWEQIDVLKGKRSGDVPQKPEALETLLDVARKLSAEFDYIRVDMYLHQGQVYVGELTNFPSAGINVWQDGGFDVWVYREYQRIRKERIAELRTEYGKNA